MSHLHHYWERVHEDATSGLVPFPSIVLPVACQPDLSPSRAGPGCGQAVYKCFKHAGKKRLIDALEIYAPKPKDLKTDGKKAFEDLPQAKVRKLSISISGRDGRTSLSPLRCTDALARRLRRLFGFLEGPGQPGTSNLARDL